MPIDPDSLPPSPDTTHDTHDVHEPVVRSTPPDYTCGTPHPEPVPADEVHMTRSGELRAWCAECGRPRRLTAHAVLDVTLAHAMGLTLSTD